MEEFYIIAGPCAVESREQLYTIAATLNKCGIKYIRGGAFKPRTSPYSWQGLGKEALVLLKEIAKEFKLKVVSEILDYRDIDLFKEYVDILQIGSRNCQNYTLLKEIGKSKMPVLIKRGAAISCAEFIKTVDYIRIEGNHNIILCERGIKTFETSTRNTLDLSAVPVLKSLTDLPVIVDPSHATGKSFLVSPMSKAALAAGADGIMIEIHPNPSKALSDGEQSLTLEEFEKLIEELEKIAQATGKTILG